MTADDADEQPTLASVTEWPGGFTWVANPDEDAERASHALETDAGVWVVDPVDADGLDARLRASGEVAGVAVVHDRHTRDADAIAERHDVPVFVPAGMTLIREKLATEPESFEGELPGTDYALETLIDTDEWEEAMLVHESSGTMVVMEALGTLPAFRANDEAVGVHPALEDAPDGLADRRPDRLLVGHGESIHTDAATALRAALADDDGAAE